MAIITESNPPGSWRETCTCGARNRYDRGSVQSDTDGEGGSYLYVGCTCGRRREMRDEFDTRPDRSNRRKDVPQGQYPDDGEGGYGY